MMCKLILFLSLLLISCNTLKYCNSVNTSNVVIPHINYDFQQSMVELYLKEFTANSHVFGTERQAQLSQYISNTIKPYVDDVIIMSFDVLVPNPKIKEINTTIPYNLTITKKGYNVVGILKLNTSSSCTIILGSHYDTKYIEGIVYVGANDSGSSSALLIDLMRFLASIRADLKNSKCNVIAVWFDGEESYLEGWNDGLYKHPAKIQDNTYGSRFFVNNLNMCKTGVKKCLSNELGGYYIEYVIIMDMIGSHNLTLSYDLNSDPYLTQLLKQVLKNMHKEFVLSSTPTYIEDDHIPFVKAGIKAIDIIDFNNLKFWHNENDKIANISYDSMELAGSIVWHLIYNLIKN